MKALLLILSLTSFSAFSSTEECTATLNSMTQLTYNYIDLIKTCKKLEVANDTAGRSYEGYRRISRKTEEIYTQAVDLCFRVCEDTFFCEGDGLSGACSH